MKILAGLAFFGTWLALMGSYSYFSWHVAPFALRLWAETTCYHLMSQKSAGMFDWFDYAIR